MKKCGLRVIGLLFFSFGMLWGCESGEKAVDEITGNRAVKQYHQAKKNIETISNKQQKKYEDALGDVKQDDGSQ